MTMADEIPNINSAKTSRMVKGTSQRREAVAGQHVNKSWTLFISPFLWRDGKLALCLVPLVVQFKIFLACKRWLMQSTGIPPGKGGDRRKEEIVRET